VWCEGVWGGGCGVVGGGGVGGVGGVGGGGGGGGGGGADQSVILLGKYEYLNSLQ